MGNGKRAMSNEKCAMGNGKWEMGKNILICQHGMPEHTNAAEEITDGAVLRLELCQCTPIGVQCSNYDSPGPKKLQHLW